jgi:hypothetical protein
MTEQEVIQWMSERLDGDVARKSAFGMIMADVNQYGFQTFLDMPPETIISEYLVVTEELTQDAVDCFKTLFAQEQELDSLGIDQSLRLNPSESVEAMRNGMTEIMKSLLHYIETQRMANTMIYNEEQH